MILPLTNHKIWRRELEYAAHPKNPGDRNEVLIKRRQSIQRLSDIQEPQIS